MRQILPIVSLLALTTLTLPSLLFLAGRMELNTVHWIMLLATIVWFLVATPWMWRDACAQGPQKDEAVAP